LDTQALLSTIMNGRMQPSTAAAIAMRWSSWQATTQGRRACSGAS
jgi:hypothetical protein